MRVFLCAGEASADAYGAQLTCELRRLGAQGAKEEALRLMLLIPLSAPANTKLRDLPPGQDHLSPSERFLRAAKIYEFGAIAVRTPDDLSVAEAIATIAPLLGTPSPLQFEGVGGAKMKAGGVALLEDSSTWGVISITQVLVKLPRLTMGFLKIRRELSSGEPGLFVPIDFGYMNIRLAKHAKRHGWQVLYFVPPGSWRRDRQGADLPKVTDAISTPFKWSAEILRGMGAKAYWFGHPIKQLLRFVNVTGRRNPGHLAVLPGSREHEITENLPLIASALKSADGVNSIEFALAPTVDVKRFSLTWASLSGRTQDTFTPDSAAAVLSRSDAAIVCSGTATLEAALCMCPMVVVYRLSKAMQSEVQLLRIKRPKFVALPNILLDREVVPELVQEDATAENLRQQVQTILLNPDAREEQIRAFQELDRELGPNDAITQTALLALSLISKR